MHAIYPKPKEVGIPVPRHFDKERFEAGFFHALNGHQLTQVEHLRKSFRFGYRAGKIYLRQLRKERGLETFPVQGRIRIRAAA